MRMISYAQNGEDVVLARALADTERGFYVDVGAASPDEASVTRHFYEAGWSGINIEPLPEWAALLRQVRSRDRTLELACAAESGTTTLFRVAEDPALSTLDPALAAGYRRSGLRVEELQITISTLDRVLTDAGVERIDFLKIDVEGAEESVLSGLDLTRWRPRVILVEATEPTTLIARHERFEALLRAGRYEFASTDGVNRYYARAEEAAALLPLLVPANATDDYVALRELLLEEEVTRLRVYVRHLEHDLAIEKEAAASARQAAYAPATSGPRAAPWQARSRTIALDRLAICSTPQTGAGQLLAGLAETLGAAPIVAAHPADLRFHDLPDRCVVELAWPRTEQLRTLLLSNGFRVVTTLRHPLDTLLAFLRLAQVDRETNRFLDGAGGRDDTLFGQSPTSVAFVAWATSGRGEALLDISATWASDPATLKVGFDAQASDPAGALGQLLELGGYEAALSDLPAKLGVPVDLESVEGGWKRYLSASTLARLWPAIRTRAVALGFPDQVDHEGLPSEVEAEASWAQQIAELRLQPPG